MISGQWFQRKRSKNLKYLHKITHNSIKNRGSTLNLTHLVGVHLRNIHTKFEVNLCFGLRDDKYVILLSNIYTCYITTKKLISIILWK